MVDTASHGSTSVGPSMLIRGNLQGDEDLTILGRVEGSVQLSRTLIVEDGGIVKADVDVRNAVISGIVVGNVTASDSVEITESGRVVGDIAAPRVLIVDGARFRGMVDMGDLDTPRASEPLPARTVSRASMGGRAPVVRPPTPRPSTPAPRPSPAPARAAVAPAPAPAPAAPKPAPEKAAAAPAAPSKERAPAPAPKAAAAPPPPPPPRNEVKAAAKKKVSKTTGKKSKKKVVVKKKKRR